MLNNLVIRVLSIYLLFAASASSIIISVTSSTTNSGSAMPLPTRQDEAEEAKVTAAPELKRQESTSTNYCTEWSYTSGDPPVGCGAPNTCLFTSWSAFGVAYCGIPGSTYAYFTACSDYPALTTAPPPETLHCPSTLPYCHTANFIADSSNTYIMVGCDSWEGTTSVAYPIAGAVITTPSSASPADNAQQTTFGSVTLPVPSIVTVEYIPSPSSTSSQSSSPAPASSVPSSVNTAAAIGGALGGVASVVLAILAIYKFWSKRKKEPLNP